MKRIYIVLILAALVALPAPAFGSATDVYLAQNAAGAADGSSCGNARDYTFFNSAGNWGSGSSQIGPDTTVHLCGTFSGSNGQQWLIAQGSGASGHPITIKFETGASFQAPYHSSAGAIVLDNRSFFTVDGGTNGFIENTLNGTSGASCPGGLCSQQQSSLLITAVSSANIEIKNLTLGPVYVHMKCEASSGCDSITGVYSTSVILHQGSNFLFHHNVVHDVSAPIRAGSSGSNQDNIQIYNNEFYNFNTGIECAGDYNDANIYIYSDKFHDMDNWDTGAADSYHHEAVHCYKGGGFKVQNLYIYNSWFYGNKGDCCSTAWVFLDPNGLPWCSDGTCTAYVWNNIFATTSSNTFGDGMLDITGGSGHQIYNNVFLGNGAVNTAIRFDSGSGVSSPKNVSIENNAIDNCGQFISDVGQSSTITAIDYNVYGRAFSGSPWWQFAGSSGSTFASWQASCNCDPHSQFTNAALGLVSAGVPQSGFAGIGKGLNLISQAVGNLISLAKDTSAGNSRTPVARPASGSWDVGAYVYLSSSSSSVAPPSNLSLIAH